MRKLTHVGVLQTRYCKLNLEPDYKSGSEKARLLTKV